MNRMVIVEYLVQEEAKTNENNKYGETPLLVAIRKGQYVNMKVPFYRI
jgi:ankyrin repeat protein